MWVILILLIASVAASEDEGHTLTCGHGSYMKCEGNMDVPDEFPGTEEELEEFCKFAGKLFDCLVAEADECEEKGVFPEYAREMQDTIKRVCDKDNPLHSAFMEVLPCIKQHIGRIGYYPVFEESRRREFTELLTNHGLIDLVPDVHDRTGCLLTLYEFSHVASEAGIRCGDVARDFILNLVEGFDARFEKCHPDAKGQIPTIVRVVELQKEQVEQEQDEEEEEEENMIKKKK